MKGFKKLQRVAFILGLILTGSSSWAQMDETVTEENGNRNIPERQEWLRDMGFGMFIHWSIDSQLGTVISHSLVGASEDYSNRYFNELPQTFNPVDFDPTVFFEQKADGLHVSVVRGQRIYNNSKWPNPISIKLA